MEDELPLDELEKSLPYLSDLVQKLREKGVKSYSRVFALVRDENADSSLRKSCMLMLHSSHSKVDKRKAVWPLLSALNSKDDDIRREAANTLGSLGNRRATPALIALLEDKSEVHQVRLGAVQGLSLMDDSRAYPAVKRIIFDATENLDIRCSAIEWLGRLAKDERVSNYLELLSDPIADIRFWAAYGLSQTFVDISDALEKLDAVVAYDHTVPETWGWHVDREAICALEQIYYASLRACDDGSRGCFSWLISPVPEYDTFVHDYRKWQADWRYETLPTPPVTLHIDPSWLADKLRERWPDLKLNFREPRPQAYLIDWMLTFDDRMLIGALHRDQYAVVLTGDAEDVFKFAAWYRSVIDAEQPLFLYEWADIGDELKMGISAEEMGTTIEERDEKRMAKPAE